MALTSTFNDYARKNNLLKEKEDNLSGEDIREGLTSVISIKIGEPQFEGQTKQKLGNSEARGAVNSILSEQLKYFLEQNPQVAKIICEKAVLAQRARDAARKARDLTRRKTALDGMSLPGNLPIVQIRIRKTVRSISSREILRVVLQRRLVPVQLRQSCLFVVKS